MKKLFLSALLLMLCLLPACGRPAVEPAASPAPSPSPTPIHTPMPTPEAVEAPALENAWGSALIINVSEGGLIVLLDDPNGTARMPMPDKIGFASEELGTELLPGMTVELAGSGGGILLTSPAQINPSELMAVSYDGGLINLYREVLCELEGRSPELDEGTGFICIDLHNAANLPFGAGGAITWCAGLWFSRDVLSGTLGWLNDNGYLSGPNLHWEDGVFIELRTEDVTEDSFTLICTKQRSREEKLCLTVKAEKSSGLWTWRET